MPLPPGRKAIIAATVLVLGACTASAPPPLPPARASRPPATPPVSGSRVCFDQRTQDVIRLANAERTQRGMRALEPDARLQAAAQEHADDMARGDFMAHEGSDRSLAPDRVDRVGYHWKEVAENVAAGFPDAASVHAGWMQSDGHRENILTPNVRHVGIGFAIRPDTQLRWYWVEVFAAGEEGVPTAGCG